MTRIRKQTNAFFKGAASVLSIMPIRRDIKKMKVPVSSDYEAK